MAHNTSGCLWYFHNETRSGGYLSHGFEGSGGRNFCFDFLKYMNSEMEEKGIVGTTRWHHRHAASALHAVHCSGSGAEAAVLWQETIAGKIDVEGEEPETSENPMQSF